jgi:hypothetical protein
MEQPIIILGAARSGTTLIGSIFKEHPDVAYWEEPNFVWKYKTAYLGHDMIPVKLATEDRRSFIEKNFDSFLNESGKKVFVEKTPANAYRIAYIHKLFPNAKFIHLIRDGREVALSARKKWLLQGDANKNNIPSQDKSKFRDLKVRFRKLFELNLKDLFFYTPMIVDSLLVDMKLKSYSFWGPRFPGIKVFKNSHTLIETTAMQWKYAVDIVNCYKKNIKKENFLEFKYEEFVANPYENTKRLFEFCKLEMPVDFEKRYGYTKNNKLKWKSELKRTEIINVENLIGSSLDMQGYPR